MVKADADAFPKESVIAMLRKPGQRCSLWKMKGWSVSGSKDESIKTSCVMVCVGEDLAEYRGFTYPASFPTQYMLVIDVCEVSVTSTLLGVIVSESTSQL